MVWIPEDVVWAKAYQLCGPERNATPFWSAARQILEAQERLVLADKAVQDSEAKAQRAEDILHDAESRCLTAEQSLQDANRRIQTLEAALASQRSSSGGLSSSPAVNAPASADRSNPLMLALWIAFFAVVGLTVSVVVPFVFPNGAEIETQQES